MDGVSGKDRRYGRAGLGVQTESKLVQACFDQDDKYATQQPVPVQVVK